MASSSGGSSSQTQNPDANQSTVIVSGYVTLDQYSYYYGQSTTCTVYINGVGYNQAGLSSMASNQTHYFSHSVTFTHDANGARGAIGTSVAFSNPSATYLNSSGGTGTVGALDYNRSAKQASAPTASRNVGGNVLSLSATDPGANYSGPQRDFDWQYRPSYSSTWIDLAATADPSTSVNVDVNTTYYARVLAYNSDGSNGYSGESSASHGLATAPTTIFATRSTTTSGVINISWTAPSYTGGTITAYKLYRDNVLINTANITSFSDTGRTVGQTYVYKVAAVTSLADGAMSTTASAMAPGVPSAPSSISIFSKVGRTLTINYSNSPNDYGNAITEYRMQLSTNGGISWKSWDNTLKVFGVDNTYNVVTGNTMTYNLLTPALTYLWRAYSINSIGAGATAISVATFVGAGGRRKVAGGTFEPTETAKRYNLATTSWVDLTIAKRYDAATSSWKDLT